jgi:hypothetical protein
VRKLSFGACAAVLLLPVMASAATPAGQVAVYLSNPIIDYGNTYSNSGTGAGVRGWGMLNPNWSLHGEYQATAMEDDEVTVESLRLGTGFVGAMGGETMWLVKGEYVDFGSDLEQSGVGVHGGILLKTDSALSYSGTLGYLLTDDTDGPEVNVGAHYAFNPQWGSALDYRNYLGSADPSGDFGLSEFRLGGTFSFK